MLGEILIQAIMEGLIDATKNMKVPIVIRLLIYSVIWAIPISIGILCAYSAYKAIGIIGAIVCGTISISLIVTWICGCRKIIKTRKVAEIE